MLVGENMLCKVSDFGLSRELHAKDDQEPLDYETQVHAQVFQSTSPNCQKIMITGPAPSWLDSQLVVLCTGIVEDVGSNPVEA